MEKVRWGFIGAGNIAKKALYPALMKSEVAEIYAVAARDETRAKELSPSGKTYGTYDELLADPMVEAVYISLPNSLHIPWSIKAMQAGKHVLCEKPLAMNAEELQSALDVKEKTGVYFMEASWNRWHPRTIRFKELYDSGVIGEAKSIRSCFTYDGLPMDSIQTEPELGGGGTYDLGSYSLVAPLWLMDFAAHDDVETEVTWHSKGTDETVRTTFMIGSATAETVTSMNTPETLYFDVTGEFGSLSMPGNQAFNSHNEASVLEITINGEKSFENFEACDPYLLMADAFSRRIRGQEGWLMPLSESLAFSEFFDEVFATFKN
jgi:D-xylose 1-dehydrogenase (NADP+, D-xylono-1,5-lactone-forming)